MTRPFLSCPGVGGAETITMRFCCQTPLVALRLAGYLQECGVACTVRVIGNLPLVELEIPHRQLDHVNFCFYLLEEWICA